MKRKHLESALSSLQREFPNPNILLEQYPTSPELASFVLLCALNDYNDIGPGRTCLDLGCGTCILSVGAAILDTDMVLAVDCDNDALRIGQMNAIDMEVMTQMNFIHARVKDLNISSSSTSTSTSSGIIHRDCNHKNVGDDHIVGDIKNITKHIAAKNFKVGNKQQYKRGVKGQHRNQQPGNNSAPSSSKRIGESSSIPTLEETRALILSDMDGVPLCSNCVDTVITNPPFGTKNNPGMDIRFLRTACRLARCTVYSFHKTSTRSFLLNLIQNEWKYSNVQVIAEMKFDIPKTYSFHKEKSVDINVDLIRIDVTSNVAV